MIFLTIVTTLKKKIFLYIYFLSTFGKSNLTYLTIDVMFSGQRFVILALFLWRGCMTFFGGQVA